jgi:hypothetical protein
LRGRSEIRRDIALDAQLRYAERHHLAPLVLRGAPPSPLPPPGATSPRLLLSNPVLGASVSLNASANNACGAPSMRTGTVMAITERAIVVQDNNNPPGAFTTAEYQSIARSFDTLVYPVTVHNFGEPRDTDGNGRTVLFFTAEVNKLTPPGAPGGSVAGFFFARDLFPRTGNSRLAACSGSNEGELLYLMVPDPLGTINGNQRDKEFVLQRIEATMAHELQHLINASRRLHDVHAEYPEQDWLNEGLSHEAEELLFFRAAALGPGQYLGAVAIGASEELEAAFLKFQSDNVVRLGLFLEETNVPWPFQNGPPDAATRGAAALFLRYLVDRMDTPHQDSWRALVAGPATGLKNLEQVIQADPMQWMRDWAMSLFLDNTTHSVSPQFQQQSWRIRSLILGILDKSVFQLGPIRLQDALPVSAAPVPGGAVYFRFGVPPSINSTLVLTPGGENPGSISLLLLRSW